ncbi:MAG TPA: hypothetical protein PLP50_00860 [Thermoanaerobaculia bacterium]|nr:hypothetical protein [Thermoanaerobaculia bacterium]HQN08472.1 hypothetical protein [Thermoanaerobaculia bacterium]HQP85066.1 hypothetical protein [Thermoanaerobaculia bacterium]
MIASLFKSGAEKIAARLANLETEAAALAKRAEEARAAEAEAQDRLVEDLAEGLPVDDWRKKRDAAEKKAADAERDLAAAQRAAELVRAKLEEAREAERLGDLRRRYADGRERYADVFRDYLAAGKAFSEALGRLEGYRSEMNGIFMALRAAGDRETAQVGIPTAENVLSDDLGHAEGRERFPIDVPIWPSKGGA